jgi:hypothetical protein
MRQTFSIILFLLLGLTAYSQKDSIRGKQFQLTGRITGKIQLTPACGMFAFATVLQFEWTKLTGMTYKNKNLAIIVPCPDMYKQDFFEKGRSYQVVFSDTNQANFDWTIPNKDLLKTNSLPFDPYAISIKKIP